MSKPVRFLLFLFIAMPILEMFVLIRVGSSIGALNTILLVLATAIIGLGLLRKQGLSTLLRAQDRLKTGEVPAKELAEGLFLAIGGALLLTPGFVTDFIGFCCLLPGIRHMLIAWAGKYILQAIVNAQGASQPLSQAANAPSKRNNGDAPSKIVIEGEYRREDESS